jgi:hypothetical protein
VQIGKLIEDGVLKQDGLNKENAVYRFDLSSPSFTR